MSIFCRQSGMLAKALRPAQYPLGVRLYSTETTTAKKSSSFRGGMFGFLLGVAMTGSAGYYYLLEEYNNASASLLLSVKELQESTEKVKEYARRIEAVDKDIAKIKDTAATVQQLRELRVEFRKLYDTVNIEHLELKTHIWGIEKDLSHH